MKTKIASILIILFGLAIGSCKKYPDGPEFTVLTKKYRLVNSWKIQNGFINGVDKTSNFNTTFQNANFIFTKDNLYGISYKFMSMMDYTESGTWVWSGDKKSIYLTITSAGGSGGHKYEILRLKQHELWIKETQSNNDVWEFHLIPK
ncbi:MAG TPA: hypothetical protein VNX68_03810 [Nitrosopumilaceae archaeon]|jgi:hypothetical protein|nr:hypothetical protein [Nitrosopumilaceae archaeon]